MRHLVDGLVVEAADAGVPRKCLVVQYVTTVADGVDRDGPNEAFFNGEARGAASWGGAAAEQAAESVFRVEESPCVVSGVTMSVFVSAIAPDFHGVLLLELKRC